MALPQFLTGFGLLWYSVLPPTQTSLLHPTQALQTFVMISPGVISAPLTSTMTHARAASLKREGERLVTLRSTTLLPYVKGVYGRVQYTTDKQWHQNIKVRVFKNSLFLVIVSL